MIEGIHFLLTYRCNFKCDHCFLYCSPKAKGVFTIERIKEALDDSKNIPTVNHVIFEGGEPFMYYDILLKGIRYARELNLDVGIVTNGHWAKTRERARAYLKPLQEFGLTGISLSDDSFHYGGKQDTPPKIAHEVCEELGIPNNYISIEPPCTTNDETGPAKGEPVVGGGTVFLDEIAELYFVDMLGFALMGNHFHLLVRMHPNEGYTDKNIQERVNRFYDGDKVIHISDVEKYRHKLGSLSEFVRDIKQGFTRRFNKENKRKGFFWGQRFKSVIVENGDTLVHCLAYIDLNPVRANIVEKPEDYRWNTLGYLLQTNNKDGFLSLGFGLSNEETLSFSEKLQNYRQFVYETGVLPSEKGKSIDDQIVETERQKDFQVTRMERFKYRTRYFTDSGVIGSKQFVRENYQRFKGYFECKHDKVPVSVKGLDGLYSLKRLANNII